MPPKLTFEKLILRPINSLRQKRGGYEELKSAHRSRTPSLASKTSRASLPKKGRRSKQNLVNGIALNNGFGRQYYKHYATRCLLFMNI